MITSTSMFENHHQVETMINTTDYYYYDGAIIDRSTVTVTVTVTVTAVVITGLTSILLSTFEYLDDHNIIFINNRYLQTNDNNTTNTNTTNTNTTSTDTDTDTDTDDNPEKLSDGTIIKQTLSIYGTFFLICLILFCILRKQYPKAYNLRSGWIDTLTTSSSAKRSSSSSNIEGCCLLSWLWNVWFISDIELSDECGMDALCLCRVIEWGTKLCFIGSLLGCIFLMPIYATAGDGNGVSVEQLNTSNVPNNDHGGRFVATVIAAYIIFGYTMYTCILEFEWFYMFRYDFLSKPISRNYSVYVRNLSDEYMTRKSLSEYFSHFEDNNSNNNNNNNNNININNEAVVSLLSSVNNNNNNNNNGNGNTTKAWVSLQIPNLQKLVSKRSSVLTKLEHAINIEDVTGNIPKVKRNIILNVVSTVIHPLDNNNNNNNNGRRSRNDIEITVVESLFDELKELNKEIKLSIERIEYRAQLDNPYDYNPNDYINPLEISIESGSSGNGNGNGNGNGGDGDTFFDTINSISTSTSTPPGAALRSTTISRGAIFNVPETIVDEETVAVRENDEDGDTLFATDDTTDVDNVVFDGNNENGNGNRSGSLKDKFSNLARTSVNVVGNQVGNVTATVTNTVSNGVGTVTNVATQLIPFISNGDDDGIPMTAGFVSFRSLFSTQVAKQIIHSSQDVFGIEVFEAPDKDDINWSNVGKTHKELQFGLLISYTLTTILCFFWTAVITIIASLASVEGLIDVWPKLADLFVKAPWLEAVLAQLAPLLIIVSNEVLKIILVVLSGLEGPVSGAEIQASTFSKLSAFMIIQTFFVNAVSGSVISQISAMVDNPTMIISLLANSLPNQSSYFIQILLADTCITLSVELLRVSAVATAAVRYFVGPNLTEEERRTTWMGIRPFADPTRFQHAQILSGMVLYFIVFFVYATLAPITSIFIFICFLFMGAAYRHQFIFIYPTKPDSGGKLWVQFMRLVPVCILIAELTIVGFLGLKTAPIALALMIPLIIITILFTIYIHQKHFIAANHLPGCDCVDADRKNNIDGPMDMRFLTDQYLQPELRDKVLYPTNASLQRQLKHGMIGYPARGCAAAVDGGSDAI